MTGGFTPGGVADAGDAAAFLGRVVDLDPAAVVRLRGDGAGRVAAYVRLPFGVLVSRTVGGGAEPSDVTVGAADLLTALDHSALPSPPRAVDPPPAYSASAGSAAPAGSASAGSVGPVGSAGRGTAWPVGGVVAWPVRRDVAWRAALPPADGWRRLDAVPGDVVRDLVRAGREALRAVPAGAPASAGESLLDHESLTVSGAGRTAAVPLRVLSALTRMGFLGADRPAGDVVVSATGGWVRLAAAYGSAYQHTAAPGLGLSVR